MHRTQRRIPSQPKRFEHFLPHWFFLGIVFLVLMVSFAGPEWLPPSRVPDRLVTYPFGPGVAQANDCPPPNPCGYWDGYRWHCACGGGGDKPPSISGNVSCGKAGQNGWCLSNAQLSLTASDPQGYAVTISGDLNGSPFTCGSSCTLTLPKGTGTANYTVTASTSNLTASGNTTWKYDPDPPVSNLNVSGTNGSNGWYISPVNIAAAGTDSISGMAGASISVDGGAEQSSAALDDGIHQIVASAIDNAGNPTSTTFTIKVDSTTPQIDVSAAGAPGSNGWYVSDVQVSANASDAMSGMASFEVSVDGMWQTYSAPVTLSDGIHSVQFKTTDNAGNVTTTAAQTYSVDTTAPVITPAVTGTNGNNSWYKSNVLLSASANDATSGMDTFEVTVDGGAWMAYPAPITVSDGNHSVQFRATDKAGNASQITQSIAVDTEGPVVHLPSKWTLGQDVKFTITDPVSGLAAARVVIEDQAEKYKKVHWDKTVSSASFSGEINWGGQYADGTAAPPGDYEVWVKTSDNAGNETFQLGWVTVPEPSVFSWILPPLPTWTAAPTTAPSPTLMPTIQPTAAVRPALSAVEASAPSKPAMIVVSSSSAGGIRNNQPAPDPIQSNLPLVSAAVAAMAAAAAYEAKRKQEAEQAAHLAIAQRNAKRNGKKDSNPMSYRQIAKAYQASLNNFKAKLIGQGLSDTEASAFQKQAIQNGNISSVQGIAQDAAVEKQREQQEQQDKLLAKNADTAPLNINKINQLAQPGTTGIVSLNPPFPLLHYYQNQGMVAKTGPVECVTTSVVMGMNIIKDILAQNFNRPPIPDIRVQDYVSQMDKLGWSELPYRVPSDFPDVPVINMPIDGWMHPVIQAPNALNQFSAELRDKYGCGFTVRQTSGNTLDDIARNLREGNPVLAHGLWQVTNPSDPTYKLGGFPHTMLPVEVDASAKTVTLLDPAYPKLYDPNNPTANPNPELHVMSDQEFQEWWDRQSTANLYTAPNTMTVLVPDTSCVPIHPPVPTPPAPASGTPNPPTIP